MKRHAAGSAARETCREICSAVRDEWLTTRDEQPTQPAEAWIKPEPALSDRVSSVTSIIAKGYARAKASQVAHSAELRPWSQPPPRRAPSPTGSSESSDDQAMMAMSQELPEPGPDACAGEPEPQHENGCDTRCQQAYEDPAEGLARAKGAVSDASHETGSDALSLKIQSESQTGSPTDRDSDQQ